MNPLPDPNPVTFYDARLLVAMSDHTGEVIEFEYQGQRIQKRTGEGFQRLVEKAAHGNTAWWLPQLGQIGVVSRRKADPWGDEIFEFSRYVDQSLRRAYELDTYRVDSLQIGWRTEARPEGFLAPPGLIPGEHGEFVPDKTVPVILQVPPEFVRLCRHYKQSVETVLRGFIADAAGLSNGIRVPRADGYNHNGSSECDRAIDYLQRAYGCWVDDEMPI